VSFEILVKSAEFSQFLFLLEDCSRLEVRRPKIADCRPLFCSEEQSAGTNGVCTVGVDMTAVEQRGSAAHSTFVIENTMSTV